MVALAYLGADTELADGLAAMPHNERISIRTVLGHVAPEHGGLEVAPRRSDGDEVRALREHTSPVLVGRPGSNPEPTD